MEIHTLINSKAITLILEVQMHKNINRRRQTAVPAALRMDHTAALSSCTPLRFFFFFSVQLILIKFTVATNTTHEKILSCVLKCMYMHMRLCL